jgi:hypothetical protein
MDNGELLSTVEIGGKTVGGAPVFDPEEDRNYCRSLMAPEDLALLKEDITRSGFMTIEHVRVLIQQNSVKEAQDARGEIYIEPDTIMQIDLRTDFHVFISGDSVYTSEGLFEHFPFKEFRTTPEEVFVQQEIGVFAGAINKHVARDVGGEEFFTIEELVSRAVHKKYKSGGGPQRIVKTKVFLGKERWNDFKEMKRLVRSLATFVSPLMVEGGESALTYLFPSHGRLAIQDGAALDRSGAALERVNTALSALEERVEALRAKEEELQQREKDLYKSLGIAAPRA